jgi:hypothetical protein
MFLLGTHRFFTEGIAEDAVNGAWRFVPRFDANFPLRQVGNVQLCRVGAHPLAMFYSVGRAA